MAEAAPRVEPILVPLWPGAGNALGVGRTTVFRLAASGDLPTVLLGSKRLVHVDDLRAFADSLRNEAHTNGSSA